MSRAKLVSASSKAPGLYTVDTWKSTIFLKENQDWMSGGLNCARLEYAKAIEAIVPRRLG